MATTIQVTKEEDGWIDALKSELELPSKRAVVLEGLRLLRRSLEEQQRSRRLQRASQKVSGSSRRENLQWSPQSSALKVL